MAISDGVSKYEDETRRVPVTPFIVVPRDKFDKGLAQSNSGVGIKDT